MVEVLICALAAPASVSKTAVAAALKRPWQPTIFPMRLGFMSISCPIVMFGVFAGIAGALN
jgi:hypothetical protein